MAMIVHRVKSFIEGLLTLRAKIPLATVRSFAMFMGAWTTAEPTFHRLCWGVDGSLILTAPPKLDALPVRLYY